VINIVLLLALAALIAATRSFTDASGSSGTALSFGYLLLSGFFMGRVFARLGLPKLTGYLCAGLLAGPSVLGLVPEAGLAKLSIFNGIAISLIALTAGLELEVRKLRPLWRSVSLISLIGVGVGLSFIAALLYVVRDRLAFMRGVDTTGTIAICALLGVVMVAQSPAVVVALRDETDADGPVVQTVLGVVVVGDLLVILLFAAVSSIAKLALGATAAPVETLKAIAWELIGSLGCGLVIGILLAGFLRTIRSSAGLFVVGTCFVVAEVGRRIHLDPLLVSLSAGILVRNLTGQGARLHDGIEASALPVYVVFFAVTGATIHLGVLATVGLVAVLAVLARACGLLAGSYLGARLAGAPETVRRYAGFGLLPQAGLALALALLFAKTFPEFGADAGALVLGVVALNEIIAPAIYRFAILRAGEARAVSSR
jgi:Kef-type K+ transport system membrane component KefB